MQPMRPTASWGDVLPSSAFWGPSLFHQPQPSCGAYLSRPRVLDISGAPYLQPTAVGPDVRLLVRPVEFVTESRPREVCQPDEACKQVPLSCRDN